MMQAIRAEVRKIFTLRSTYAVFGLVFAVLCLFAFYAEGYKATDAGLNPFKMSSVITNTVMTTGIFLAVIVILLVTHEYRYNTIMHTLTLSKSRFRVLLAKFLVVSVLSVVFTVISIAVAILLTRLGLAVGSHDLMPQTIYYGDIVWRILFYSWAYSLIALLIAVLVRNQVGSFTVFLFFPSTIEPLLGLVLKSNSAYLPFNLLNTVVNNITSGSVIGGYQFTITQTKAVSLLLLYLAIGWLITAVLFVRRDAN